MLSVAEAEAERASPLRNYELCQIKSQLETSSVSANNSTMSLSLVSSGTIPRGSLNTSPRKKRFDVLAIQPYDQMLYVVIVQRKSFHGHN